MGTTFHVIIDDVFHNFDPAEQYEQPGAHTTAKAAVAAAQKVVDDFLASAHVPGMRATELVQSFAYFGDSPFVKSSDGTAVPFSAIGYAEQRAAAMTQAQ